MRKLFWITLLGAALTNLGCVVPSLHPLFTEDDLVFDPPFIGAWTDSDGDFWVFDKSSTGGYLLTVADTREISGFDAHLLQLGPHRFLDLFPRFSSLEGSLHQDHLLAIHTFYKVEFEGERILADSAELVLLFADDQRAFPIGLDDSSVIELEPSMI